MSPAAHPIRRRFPLAAETPTPSRGDVKLFAASFVSGFVIFSALIF